MIVLNKTVALHKVKKIFFAASCRIRINATDTLTSPLKQLIYMLQEIGNSRKPNYNENDFLKFDIDSNLSFFFLNKRYMLISIASPPLKTLKSKYLVHKFNKITTPYIFKCRI